MQPACTCSITLAKPAGKAASGALMPLHGCMVAGDLRGAPRECSSYPRTNDQGPMGQYQNLWCVSRGQGWTLWPLGAQRMWHTCRPGRWARCGSAWCPRTQSWALSMTWPRVRACPTCRACAKATTAPCSWACPDLHASWLGSVWLAWQSVGQRVFGGGWVGSVWCRAGLCKAGSSSGRSAVPIRLVPACCCVLDAHMAECVRATSWAVAAVSGKR